METIRSDNPKYQAILEEHIKNAKSTIAFAAAQVSKTTNEPNLKVNLRILQPNIIDGNKLTNGRGFESVQAAHEFLDTTYRNTSPDLYLDKELIRPCIVANVFTI